LHTPPAHDQKKKERKENCPYSLYICPFSYTQQPNPYHRESSTNKEKGKKIGTTPTGRRGHKNKVFLSE
jgi:hypothetical protein